RDTKPSTSCTAAPAPKSVSALPFICCKNCCSKLKPSVLYPGVSTLAILLALNPIPGLPDDIGSPQPQSPSCLRKESPLAPARASVHVHFLANDAHAAWLQPPRLTASVASAGPSSPENAPPATQDPPCA